MICVPVGAYCTWQALKEGGTKVRVEVTDEVHFCHWWLGKPNSHGYGDYRWKGKLIRVHRLAWAFVTGEWLPREVELHHLCENYLCVRVLHLKPMSPVEHGEVERAKDRRQVGIPEEDLPMLYQGMVEMFAERFFR